MSELPLLLNGEMVRAVLAGRKTQTRRPVKPQPTYFWHGSESLRDPVTGVSTGLPYDRENDKVIKSPFGEPGDELCPVVEIPSCPGYAADTAGQIWNAVSGKALKASDNGKGYLTVTPAIGGKYPTRLVHRLVAEAFYGYEPQGLKQVRHLDGDQQNNAPGNLDWGSQEDNWSDRLAHGRGCGASHHAAKLTKRDVGDIRESTESQYVLAKRYGVHQAAISSIKTGKTWKEGVVAAPVNCPRWASRLQLRVLRVWVERVQEISEEDAIAEGIHWQCGGVHPAIHEYSNGDGFWTTKPWVAFGRLWDSIYADDCPWESNPWVWCCEFERIKP